MINILFLLVLGIWWERVEALDKKNEKEDIIATLTPRIHQFSKKQEFVNKVICGRDTPLIGAPTFRSHAKCSDTQASCFFYQALCDPRVVTVASVIQKGRITEKQPYITLVDSTCKKACAKKKWWLDQGYLMEKTLDKENQESLENFISKLQVESIFYSKVLALEETEPAKNEKESILNLINSFHSKITNGNQDVINNEICGSPSTTNGLTFQSHPECGRTKPSCFFFQALCDNRVGDSTKNIKGHINDTMPLSNSIAASRCKTLCSLNSWWQNSGNLVEMSLVPYKASPVEALKNLEALKKELHVENIFNKKVTTYQDWNESAAQGKKKKQDAEADTFFNLTPQERELLILNAAYLPEKDRKKFGLLPEKPPAIFQDEKITLSESEKNKFMNNLSVLQTITATEEKAKEMKRKIDELFNKIAEVSSASPVVAKTHPKPSKNISDYSAALCEDRVLMENKENYYCMDFAVCTVVSKLCHDSTSNNSCKKQCGDLHNLLQKTKDLRNELNRSISNARADNLIAMMHGKNLHMRK